MNDTIIKILYMVSCIFFIRGIKLLGKTDTARKGNLYSSIGMLIACVTVLCEKEVLGSWSLNILENGYFYVAAAILIGGLIGAIAFTGSVVAWGKLSGKMFKKNVAIPGKNIVNAILAFIALAGIVAYAFFEDTPCGGITFVGFAINNTVLVVSGCLVGASGLILTLIMCKAMNRTMFALLFKSFGGGAKKKADGEAKEPKSLSVEDAYIILEAAKNVVVIPGYGMAVAQAQHAVKELCDKLEDNGAEVNFAIHPVAGRMPGHMNVLLAEANVPYEQLKTADEMNPQMSNVDVAIVIGANDVVNPDAINDQSSPLYGMPIVNAFEAKTVFVLKRGKGTGFSGLENPLYTNDNTVMIYGDAKATVTSLASEFENA